MPYQRSQKAWKPDTYDRVSEWLRNQRQQSPLRGWTLTVIAYFLAVGLGIGLMIGFMTGPVLLGRMLPSVPPTRTTVLFWDWFGWVLGVSIFLGVGWALGTGIAPRWMSGPWRWLCPIYGCAILIGFFLIGGALLALVMSHPAYLVMPIALFIYLALVRHRGKPSKLISAAIVATCVAALIGWAAYRVFYGDNGYQVEVRDNKLHVSRHIGIRFGPLQEIKVIDGKWQVRDGDQWIPVQTPLKADYNRDYEFSFEEGGNLFRVNKDGTEKYVVLPSQWQDDDY
jgi:hypothetical protein